MDVARADAGRGAVDAPASPRKASKGPLAADGLPDYSEGVVFFDLDDTLIDVNSAWLWAKHEWNIGRITVFMLVQAIYYMIRYALGYVENMESAFEVAVSNYKGVSAELLRVQTRAWFTEEVLPRTRPLARSTLAHHHSAGARCVLASSTTHFAAECAREAFGLSDAVCTNLEVDAKGFLTGRATALAFGRGKAQRVREWAERHAVPLSRCTFYTDSFADATLLAQVGTPVCVNPDRRLRALAKQRGWSIQDWGRSPVPLARLVK